MSQPPSRASTLLCEAAAAMSTVRLGEWVAAVEARPRTVLAAFLAVHALVWTALPSLIAAGTVIVLVSMLLAFLSGMNVRRRIAMNLVIISAAVVITYVIGLATKALFGVSV